MSREATSPSASVLWVKIFRSPLTYPSPRSLLEFLFEDPSVGRCFEESSDRGVVVPAQYPTASEPTIIAASAASSASESQ